MVETKNVGELIENFPKSRKAIGSMTLEKFQKTFHDTFAAILESQAETPKENVDTFKKLVFASLHLSKEIYTEIGEEFLTHEGMSLEKIRTIGIGDPETRDEVGGGLTLEQVKALGGKPLADERMTVSKINLITHMMNETDIANMGIEEILRLSNEGLSGSLF